MADYVDREDVLSAVDRAINEWNGSIGISRVEFLRILIKNLPVHRFESEEGEDGAKSK